MKYRITIKDEGNIDEMDNHYDCVCKFVTNNSLKCNVRPNMGYVTGHISIITKDLFSMGMILQQYSSEINEIEKLTEY